MFDGDINGSSPWWLPSRTGTTLRLDLQTKEARCLKAAGTGNRVKPSRQAPASFFEDIPLPGRRNPSYHDAETQLLVQK